MGRERIREAKVRVLMEASHRTIDESITCGEDETFEEWAARVKERIEEIVESIW